MPPSRAHGSAAAVDSSLRAPHRFGGFVAVAGRAGWSGVGGGGRPAGLLHQSWPPVWSGVVCRHDTKFHRILTKQHNYNGSHMYLCCFTRNLQKDVSVSTAPGHAGLLAVGAWQCAWRCAWHEAVTSWPTSPTLRSAVHRNPIPPPLSCRVTLAII